MDKNVIKILAASLLGDASLRIKKGNINAQFRLAQIVDHADHIEYIKGYVSLVTGTCEWTKTNFTTGSGLNPKNQLWLESNVHPVFLSLIHI